MVRFPVLVVSLAALTAWAPHSMAQTVYRLWEGQAPGAKGTAAADIPELTIYKPAAGAANGAAFLMVPGGGYGTVVMSEADAARSFWIPKGFVIGVLKYRVSPYQYPVPMQDIKRGMRLLRSKSKELGVDTNRVGVLGCSAGGHLASYLATHSDMGNAAATDLIERQKSRPDFSVFVYPVITMDASFTHPGSRSALIGNNPAAALVDTLSNEKQVRADAPPAYLVHGTVDNTVQWKNSQVYYDSCLSKKVAAKFQKITASCGGHGFGYTCDNWGEAGYTWLKSGGYLDKTGPVTPVLPKGEAGRGMQLMERPARIQADAAGRVLPAGSANADRDGSVIAFPIAAP